MNQANPREPFKLNPIEGALFGAIALIFCNSIYSLIFDIGSLRAAPVGSGQQAVAMSFDATSRGPASKAPGLRSIDFKCEETRALVSEGGPALNAITGDAETGVTLSASKVRLSGPLCGAPSPSAKLLKTQVVNGANKYSATVFTDVSAQKFSTDYIPLVTGRNSIHVEFAYQGGKTFSRDLELERN